MARTSLDDAQWVSLMLVMQRIPFAWTRNEAALRRFVEAALWICRTGAPWRDLPETLGAWSSVYHRWRRWCLRGWWELVFEAVRPSVPADGLLLLDSTTCKAHRAASGAAHSTASAEALGRSRGGLCSKLHACADGAGRILRLIASPGNHADLRHATALASGIPARDAALDRGYVSAVLRAAFAAEGCAVHTPPKRGMVDPPEWDPKLYARRHKVENLFSCLVAEHRWDPRARVEAEFGWRLQVLRTAAKRRGQRTASTAPKPDFRPGAAVKPRSRAAVRRRRRA